MSGVAVIAIRKQDLELLIESLMMESTALGHFVDNKVGSAKSITDAKDKFRRSIFLRQELESQRRLWFID
jgi:hypothetical protein